MTIVQVIGMGAKKFGGLERYMLELAKQLQNRGDKLIIIFDAEPKATEYIDLLSETNSEWYVIPFGENKAQYIKMMANLLKKQSPDIVQTNFCNTTCLSILWLLCKLYGVKKLYGTEHCYPIISNFRLRIVYTLISLFCYKVFCVSQTSCDSIKRGIKFNTKKIETLYLGVSDFKYDKLSMRLKYGLPETKIIIGNVAYHNPVKGVDVLLRAVAYLKSELNVSNFIVCQIGGGQNAQQTNELRQEAERMGIENYILWMGIQNNVPEILSACDIYCQPSRSEGISLSIMEASIAGIPTVATRVGGIPESAVENKNAILAESEDFRAVAVALKEFICDIRKRESYGIEARAIATQKFNSVKQVAKLIEQYID